MAYPITDIRAIGTEVAGVLKSEGIRTTLGLLRAAKTPKQRLRIAARIGADPKQVLDWATAADRMYQTKRSRKTVSMESVNQRRKVV